MLKEDIDPILQIKPARFIGDSAQPLYTIFVCESIVPSLHGLLCLDSVVVLQVK
jgi:hypothetical protein